MCIGNTPNFRDASTILDKGITAFSAFKKTLTMKNLIPTTSDCCEQQEKATFGGRGTFAEKLWVEVGINPKRSRLTSQLSLREFGAYYM